MYLQENMRIYITGYLDGKRVRLKMDSIIKENISMEKVNACLQEFDWLKGTEYLKDKKYIECVWDIMLSKPFQKMNEFIQHGTTTTLEHCISVSYFSYKMCKSMGYDYVSAARGGLLHDLFLYDWHTHCKETGNHFHGFTHPVVAHRNADKYYKLNDIEKDIIKKHMWPLTIIPPKYKEGYVVMYADKYCSLYETTNRIKDNLGLNNLINYLANIL